MKKKYFALIVCSLSSCVAVAADTMFDDVVVSVSKSEQKSFDAPASISVINKDAIEFSGPQVNISEDLNKIPGVIALNRQNYSQDLQISIRGFGARTKFGVRGVRLIADGIPATIPDGTGQASTFSLTSTEKIEVLRGPLAQFYGNASGGVIQTFTREAPDAPEFLVQGYTGSYGLQRTDWQFANKIGAYGLVADYSTFKIDGYRQNSQAERNQFNGKLTYDHDSRTRLAFMLNVFDQPYGNDPAGLTMSDFVSNPTKSNNYGVNARKIVQQNQLGTTFDHKLDNESFIKIKVYFGNRKQTAFTSATAWNGLNRDYYGLGFDYGFRTSVGQQKINWLAGGSYDKSDEINQQGTTTNASLDARSISRSENRISYNKDVFLKADTYLTDKFNVLAGFRSTHVELSAKDVLYAPPSVYANNVFNNTSPVFGLTYHIADNANIYANYGKGFETPTLVESGYIIDGTVKPGFKTNLNASISSQYEIGMKWLPTSRSRIDLSAFIVNTSNEIVVDKVTSTVTGIYTAYTNAGKTQRKGAELSLNSYVIDSVKWGASATIMEARFDSQFVSNGKTNYVGDRISGLPEKMLFTDLQWSATHFQRNRYKQILGTVVAIEYVASGDLYAAFDSTSRLRAPGYGIANAKVMHRFNYNEVVVTGYAGLNNIFDKQYIGSVIVGETSKPYESAPSRNWILGVNATVRF